MTSESTMSSSESNDISNSIETESISNEFQGFVRDIFCQKGVNNAGGSVSEEYHVEKGVNLSEILSRLASCTNRKINLASPDTYNHISILSQGLQGYLQFLGKESLDSISQKVNVDTTKWLSSLYGLENMLSYYHAKDCDGLIKVCKLALQARYTKYATDGFTALYTRPPVIYLSAATPPEFGKKLRSELGLPQSSMCSVPGNTMFGSPYTMDVTALERLLTDDVSCGKTPLILIAYAGTPISGHTDNLCRLREICTQSGVWFHVEGDTLANLTMAQVQPSIQAAVTADSLTLNFSKWYGIHNLPFCTFFQTNNIGMAYSSGLIPDAEGMLKALPLWLIIQFMGTQDLKSITEHASGLSQQMSNRLDLINSVKRIEQPIGLSPVVIFKYKALVSLPVPPKESDEDLTCKPSLIDQGLKMDVSPDVCNKYNSLLVNYLKSKSLRVVIDEITIPHEGICMRFNPLETSRTSETSKDDINDFVEMLQNKVIQMDCTLANQTVFKSFFLGIPDVVLLDVSEEPVLGAFQCIPNYWKTKTMSNLSDSKKEEANELNLKLFDDLSITYKCIEKRIMSNGQICIIVGMIDDNFDLEIFVEKVSTLSTDLQDNTKFVESVKDSVEESIREAQAKLDLERDQEGVLRNVPIVSSVFNWLSPIPDDDHGITGHSFDLSSGKLEMTNNVYKYKMQICDDESDAASHMTKKSVVSNNIADLEFDAEIDEQSFSGESVETSDVESIEGDISSNLIDKLSQNDTSNEVVAEKVVGQ